jgi:hypothetical protein
MVCLALLGLVVTFVLNLLPSSALGLQKAADVEAAAGYATQVLDDARLHASAIVNVTPAPSPTFVDVNTNVHVDRSDFHVTRTWMQVTSDPTPTLWDVSVRVQEPHGHSLTVTTRVDVGAP